MKFLEKELILSAVENPKNFLEPTLQKEKIEMTKRYKPFCYTGGITLVFKLILLNGPIAVRVWHRLLEESEDRYKKLAEYASKGKRPWLLDTQYISNGIQIKGEIYPIVTMEWSQGEPLFEYIQQNIGSPLVIQNLANNFLNLIKDLHNQDISHGDLHPKNILVEKDGKIKLIDYDSFFMPGMESLKDEINGQAAFQHPKREENEFSNKKIDYFSELIIFLGLIITAEIPDFWEQEKGSDEEIDSESFFFQTRDFDDLDNSEIYNKLRGKSPKVDALLFILKQYLAQSSLLHLEPFYNLLEPPKINSFVPNEEILENSSKGNVILSWEVEHAISVQIEGFPDSYSTELNGQYSAVINYDTEFKLIAQNAFGQSVSVMTYVRLNIVPPLIKKFRSNPERLTHADKGLTTLEWEVEGAESIKIIDYPETLSPSKTGSFEVELFQEKTFTLLAKNFRGETSIQTCIVEVSKEKPVVQYFESEPRIGFEGIPLTVRWKVEGSKSVFLIYYEQRQKIPSEGSKEITLSTQSTCYLHAISYYGVITKIPLSVIINPLPKIENLVIPNIPQFQVYLGEIKLPKMEVELPSNQIISDDLNNKLIPKSKNYTPIFKMGAIAPLFNKIKNILSHPKVLKKLQSYF